MRIAGVGAVFGFLAVALGAFGAHGLRGRLDPGSLDIYRTAVLYHLVHAVALLSVGLASERLRAARVVAVAFVAGIVLFSGSLYLLAITGVRFWGAVTPFGGVAFLVGWLVLAGAAFRRAR